MVRQWQTELTTISSITILMISIMILREQFQLQPTVSKYQHESRLRTEIHHVCFGNFLISCLAHHGRRWSRSTGKNRQC